MLKATGGYPGKHPEMYLSNAFKYSLLALGAASNHYATKGMTWLLLHTHGVRHQKCQDQNERRSLP